MTTQDLSIITTSSPKEIPRVKAFQDYLVAFFLAIACAILVLQIWDLKWLYIPFNYCGDPMYWGDSLFLSMIIKSIITSGWYFTNPSIGVPGGYFLADFPILENFQCAVIKLFSLCSSNWALIYNLFFLLGFPLITLSALFVFQRIGICYPFALTASLLFSFLPFRLLRAEMHLFLTSYYLIPLAVWLATIVHQNICCFKEAKSRIFYAITCILLGLHGIYYTYFSMFFILISGIISSYNKTTWKPLKHASVFLLLIGTSTLCNSLPTIIHQFSHGANPEPVKRPPYDTEVFGLKIVQLLLPVDNDRLFSKWKNEYNHHAFFVNENTTSTLGLIGSLGFLSLLGNILLKRKESHFNPTLETFTHLNFSALLLATIGGFSSFISYFLFPGIRCYNRISVFIAFFSLAAFFLLLQKRIHNPKLLWGWSLFLLAVGLFTQSSNHNALPPKMAATIREYKNDEVFIQKIEQLLPPGSKIFQLPYLSFPEGSSHRMTSYDHFKGPLHSHFLQWSFGAVKGRATDLWQRKVSSLEAPEMIKELIKKGFTGLYIDRNGYADYGYSIETRLSQLLTAPIVVDSHRSFWDLRRHMPSFHASKNSSSDHDLLVN